MPSGSRPCRTNRAVRPMADLAAVSVATSFAADAAANADVPRILDGFLRWLDGFGETSYDHQSFYAGAIGGRAKALYYRQRLLGTAAVAPMVFAEAFVPAARRLFYRPMRFPIADAHYAMGFAHLYAASGDRRHLERA